MVAYGVRPPADVLVLGSGGGTEVLTALAGASGHVTVIEPNELVAGALATDLRAWAGLADDPRVTIVGEHAGDLIAEYVLAMRHGLGLNKILGTIHIYPTLAEANKYAAGEWKKAHVPERLLEWVARFHAWRRKA